MSSFSRKKLDVKLVLANGAFNGNNNILELSGMRVVLEAKKVGTMGLGTKARIKIYGMSQSDMNRMSLLAWNQAQVQKNVIMVSAGYDGGPMTEVFSGQIVQAWADYSAMPEVPMVFDAIPGSYEQLQSAPPTAYQKPFAVATAMATLAGQMGYMLDNNGVDKTIRRASFKGSLMDQARKLAEMADIALIVQEGTLIISPKGVPLPGDVPVIAPDTGLIGYPSFSAKGISLSCVFSPSIKFQSLISVETDIEPARGEWIVTSLSYTLESEKPGGPWFCQIEAGRPANVIKPQ